MHKELLRQLDEDISKMKTGDPKGYEISEAHLSVVAREIHDRACAVEEHKKGVVRRMMKL